MRHLVIGASGLVGSYLFLMLEQENQPVVGTYFRNREPELRALDIRNAKSVNRIVKQVMPDVIYLVGAMTWVDYCESHAEECAEVNVKGVENVVKAANMRNSKLVFFSSDYIFDGNNGPYDENAIPNPLNEYGRQKASAEDYIRHYAYSSLIIRTTGIYGEDPQRKNFVLRLIDTVEDQLSMEIAIDQISTPTYAPQLASYVVRLALSGAIGTFNIAGGECISRYQFALAVADIFELDTRLILPVSKRSQDTHAQRPLNAGLTVDKIEAAIGRKMCTAREGLRILKGFYDSR